MPKQVIAIYAQYRRRIGVFALLVSMLITSVFPLPQTNTASAAVPKYVNFQGKLTKVSDGTNVANGNYAFRFKLYDAVTSGTLLWTETYDHSTPGNACYKLAVTNGVFNAKLGSCASLAGIDFTGGSVFISVDFAPTGTSYDGEMSPRKQLVSAPFALVANGVSGDGTVNSTVSSATALTVAKSGSNYGLQVDTSAGSAATGLKITSAAAASGIALSAISSGSNENITIDAKGSGSIGLGSTSTGDILLGGGSGSTGCTVTNSTGAFACTAGGSFTTLALTGAVTGAASYNGLVITANTGVITTGTWNGTLITSAYGGTGNGFTKFSGPASSEKTFTLPNASATILTDNAVVTVAQGGTGVGTFASNGVLYGNGTSAIGATAAGSTGQCLVATTSAAPSWGACGSGTINSGVSGYFGYYPSTGTTIDDQTVLYTDGTNIGIGDASPASLLTVGSGDLFQVNSSGTLKFNGVSTDITTGTNEALLIAPNGTGSVIVSSSVTSGSGSGSGLYATSSTVTSGTVITFSSTSTDATGNTQQVLNVSNSGANTNSNQLTYGASIANTHSGTGAVNIALNLDAYNGAANYALYAGTGVSYFANNVGIGAVSPGSLLQVQQAADSTNTSTPVAFDVNSAGASGELTATSSTQTFARIAPVINQSSTAGYTALLINATETATGSGGHYLLDVQTGGSSKFSVQSDGTVATASTIFGGNDIYAVSSGYIGFNSRSKISSPADSNILLQNSAANNFNLLLFGGQTSSFPALKRSSATLQARLGDDSGYTSFDAGNYLLSGTNINTAGTLNNVAYLNQANTFTANQTITKADPSIVLNVTTATDTDFWLGVQDDAGGDDDDTFQIGDGTTPGTNPFFTIDTNGRVGIGTTSPNYLLHTAKATNSGTVEARIENTGTTSPTAKLTIASSTAGTNPVAILELAATAGGFSAWDITHAGNSNGELSTSYGGTDITTLYGGNDGARASLALTPRVATSGSPVGLSLTGAAHTTLSNAEASDVNFNLARTVQFGQNTTLALQRAVVITAPTYSSSAATKTITDAATVGISGAPVKSTNVAITNSHALLIAAGAVSTATNSYGLTVNAQTGATNNYVAQFIGGNVGIGTASPTAFLHVGSNGAASNPGLKLSGSWFTGGDSTTTKPQLLVEASGASSTNWSTSGTGLGINAPSGFAGRMIDVKLNGTSAFALNEAGGISILGQGVTNIGAANAYWYQAGGTVSIGNNGDSGASNLLLRAGVSGSSGGNITFNVNNSNVGIWNSAGLGIGTGTPIDPLSISTAINASATHSLVNLSNTALSGASASGTYLGANPGSNSADWINFQAAGVSKLRVTSTGAISTGIWNGTVIGALYGGTGIDTSASTGVPSISSGTWSVNAQLPVSLGGTGAATLTGLLIGNGTSAVTATTISSGISGQLSDETGSGALVFGTSPTLTTPRFADLGYLADSNGNELLIFDLNASAVNEITIANAATGNGVTLAATGGDSAVNISFDAKGTGTVNLGNTSTGNVLLGGGSGSTGCTLTNSTGAFACTAAITGSNLSGTNTGDQTITLTGEVTGSGTGSFATTVTSQTSATWAGKVSDETGSGAWVFGTSPTLTTPRFADLGYIADSNGNELLIFDLNTSAVNEITIANAATGNGVTLAATGGDSAVNISFDGKGTGTVNLGGTSTGNILLGGGSGSTGCTLTNSTGAFACTAAITGSNLSGTNTGDQTITLTGDITGSGTGSFAASIGSDKVTEVMLKAVDTAADEECLTYETTTGDFEWQNCDGSIRLDQIAAATTTATLANANNAIVWNWGTLTSQTGMTFGGGTAMTTGSILQVGAGIYSHANGETGNLVTMTVSDITSAAGAVTSTTNGLHINTQLIGTTSTSGTKTLNAINIPAPTTSCSGGGSCVWNGLFVTAPATASNVASTAIKVVADSLTTDSATTISAAGITSGNALSITAGGTTSLTSGAGLKVTGPTGAAAISNGLAQITATGAYTGTGGLLNVLATTSTAGTLANFTNNTASFTGTGITASFTGTTTGDDLLISPGSGVTSGSALKVSASGTSAIANGLVQIAHSGAYTSTGGLLNVAGNSTTGGTLAAFSATSTTTGNLMTIAPGAGITSGSALQVSASGTSAIANGLVQVTHSGAYTSTGGLLNITGNSTTAGVIASLSGTSLTTGNALNIAVGSGITSGSAINVTASGTSAIANGLLQVTHSGAFTSTGGLMNLVGNSSTAGTLATVSGTGITTGTILNIAAGAGVTSGAALKVSASGTSAIANGLVQITHSGAYTSTGGLLNVTGNSTTTGTLTQFSATGLTTGTVIKATGGSAMTTGSVLDLGNPQYVHTGSETGNALAVAVTDASSNTSGLAITSGIQIQSSLSTTASVGSKQLNGIKLFGYFNSCGTTGGSCEYYGINQFIQNFTQSTTNSMIIAADTISGGSLIQNTAAGSIQWYGTNLAMPNITQTTGSITADGQKITTGSITTGGTVQGINIQAGNGAAAGTLNGINISNISAGAGTETAIKIGTGWDTGINIAGTTGQTTQAAISTSGYSYLHTGTETGSLLSLAFTDASSNTSGIANTVGINITPTFNTTASAGAKILQGIYVNPTITACGTTGGSCTLSNIAASTPTLTQSTTNTTNLKLLDLGSSSSLIQNTAAGVINWTGTSIQMPNITQTTGTVTSTGLRITGGTVTSGTANLIDLQNSSAQTLSRFYIDANGLAQLRFSNSSGTEKGVVSQDAGLVAFKVQSLDEDLYLGNRDQVNGRNYAEMLFNYSSGYISFSTATGTGATERMRLNSTGNLGIGTTSPLRRLDVAGSGRFKGTATSVITGSIDPAASTAVTGVGTLFTTELVVGDRITVTGETRTVTAISSDTALTVDTAFSNNANDTSVDKLAAQLIVKDSSDNIGFIVQDDGKTGIGTASPDSLTLVDVAKSQNTYTILRVYNSNAGSGASARIALGNDSNAFGGQMIYSSSTETAFGGANSLNFYNGANAPIAFFTNGVNQRLTISGAGALRLHTYGAGTLVTDGSGNVTASSDIRLKDVKGSFDRGLSSIMEIDPILFKWNNLSGLDQSFLNAGFSAQNIQAAIPEAVDTDPQGYLSLSDRPILAALVNATKELNNISLTQDSNGITSKHSFTFVAGSEDGQTVNSVGGGTIGSPDTSFIVNQKGSGNLLQLQKDNMDTFLVANDGTLHVNSSLVTGLVLEVKNLNTTLFTIDTSGTAIITGTLLVKKDVAVLGRILGSTAIVGKNTSNQTIHQGDLLMLTGAVDVPKLGDQPTITVSPALGGENVVLVGVADRNLSDFNLDTETPTSDDPTIIKPGEFLSIVITGTYKKVLVEGSVGIGDKLTVSGSQGKAKRVENNETAQIFGISLDGSANSEGFIRVMLLNLSQQTPQVINQTNITNNPPPPGENQTTGNTTPPPPPSNDTPVGDNPQ